MSSETDSTDGCSSNAWLSLCILLTVVAPVMTITKAALALTPAGGPAASFTCRVKAHGADADLYYCTSESNVFRSEFL